MEWKTEPENKQQDNETGNDEFVALFHLRLRLPRWPWLWPGRRGSFLALCLRAPIRLRWPWLLGRITVLRDRSRRCRRGRSCRSQRQFRRQPRGSTCQAGAARIYPTLRKSRWEGRFHFRAKAQWELSVELALAC